MNREQIKEQLKKYGLQDSHIYAVETKWGFVIQINTDNIINTTQRTIYNALLDKDGNFIYPFTQIHDTVIGNGIYASKEHEDFIYEIITKKNLSQEEILEKEQLYEKIGDGLYVSYKELDETHFIIPGGQENQHLIFIIEDDGSIKIKGQVVGMIDNLDKKLSKEKELLVRNDIDKRNDNHEEFFYSWDENCIISDRWNDIILPDNAHYATGLLQGIKNIPKEIRLKIINEMQENNACLAKLRIVSAKDYEHYMDFFALIKTNGIPLTDLLYISNEYEMHSIKLEKENIGEVDKKRAHLQEYVESKLLKVEQNKKNLIENFSMFTGIEQKNKRVQLPGVADETEFTDR